MHELTHCAKLAAPLVPQAAGGPRGGVADADGSAAIGVLEVCLDPQTEAAGIAMPAPAGIDAGAWHRAERDALDRIARMGGSRILSAQTFERRLAPARQLALFSGVRRLPAAERGMAAALAEAASGERATIWAVSGSSLELLPPCGVVTPLAGGGVLAAAARGCPLLVDASDPRLLGSRELRHLGPCLRCLLLLPLVTADGAIVGVAAVADPRATAQRAFDPAAAAAAIKLARSVAASLELVLETERGVASRAHWHKQVELVRTLSRERRRALPVVGELISSSLDCRALAFLCPVPKPLPSPHSPKRTRDSAAEQPARDATSQDELGLVHVAPASGTSLLSWGAHRYAVQYGVGLDVTDDQSLQSHQPQLARLGLYRSRSVLRLPLNSFLPLPAAAPQTGGRRPALGVLDLVERTGAPKFTPDDVAIASAAAAVAAMALTLEAIVTHPPRLLARPNLAAVRLLATWNRAES